MLQRQSRLNQRLGYGSRMFPLHWAVSLEGASTTPRSFLRQEGTIFLKPKRRSHCPFFPFLNGCVSARERDSLLPPEVTVGYGIGRRTCNHLEA